MHGFQDERLREGVRLHRSEGWKKVVEYVGGGRSVNQCQKRWGDVLRYVEEGFQRNVVWTDEQVRHCVCMLHLHLL